MHIIDSREFNENDYLAYSGANEVNGHKPRITEFEDGLSGIDLVLAQSSEDEILIQINIYQGETDTSFIKSFKTYGDAEEVFKNIESELEDMCIGEALDYLSSLSFDKPFKEVHNEDIRD